MDLFILVPSLLILLGLGGLHYQQVRTSYQRGYEAARAVCLAPRSQAHGLAPLPADEESEYAKGYRHGYELGFQRAAAEAETSAAKGWSDGYTQAITDMATEMQAAEVRAAADEDGLQRIAAA